MLLSALILLASLLALSAHAHPADVRASELLDKPVRSAQGAPLGKIAALFLHLQPNGVNYVELAYRDAAGEEQRFAYPVNAFARGDGALRLKVPPAHLEKSGDLRLPHPQQFVEATDVLKRPVDDRLGNTVGRLTDVVVNLDSGRTRSYLIVFDEQPGTPLPMSAHLVRLQATGNPVLHADPARRAALDGAFVSVASEVALQPASCGVRQTLWRQQYAVELLLPAGASVLALVDPAQRKALRLRLVDASLMPARIPARWHDALASVLDEGALARLQAAYRNLRGGEVVVLAYEPSSGVSLHMDERLLARAEGHAVVDALLAAWAEDHLPLDEQLMRATATNRCA